MLVSSPLEARRGPAGVRPTGAGGVAAGGAEVLALQPVDPSAAFRAPSFPGGSGIGGQGRWCLGRVAALMGHMWSLPSQGCFLSGPEPKEPNLGPGESSQSRHSRAARGRSRARGRREAGRAGPCGLEPGTECVTGGRAPSGRARRASASRALWRVGCWPLSRAEGSREPGGRDASRVRTGIRD